MQSKGTNFGVFNCIGSLALKGSLRDSMKNVFFLDVCSLFQGFISKSSVLKYLKQKQKQKIPASVLGLHCSIVSVFLLRYKNLPTVIIMQTCFWIICIH